MGREAVKEWSVTVVGRTIVRSLGGDVETGESWCSRWAKERSGLLASWERSQEKPLSYHRTAPEK